jgi:molybdenum cofactor biosynthesis protein A
LRCTYCMPSAGIQLSPKESLMTSEEVYEIAKVFVHHGVNKIRLTGGEPLLRKDFGEILERLSTLKVLLALTTNGVLLDRYLDDLKRAGLRKLNFSLDTLNPESFNTITLRDQFERVHNNLKMALEEGFDVKINAVLLKGQNEEEIIDFIALTERAPLSIRFIEFMPFQGNAWDQSKTVSLASILELIEGHYGRDRVERLQDAPNDTAKNYKIGGFKGSFAVISTVTNPFCDSCNRIRLTANGRLRNCLFSDKEQDLLGALRSGEPIEPVIQKVLQLKKAVRAGLDSPETFEDYHNHQSNRSMIKIGG